MLIPRFSLRWLIGLITVCGVISLVLSYAFQGEPWAIGFAAGIASLAVLFALHASAFAVAYVLAEVFHLKPRVEVPAAILAGDTPFAATPFAAANPSNAVNSEPPVPEAPESP